MRERALDALRLHARCELLPLAWRSSASDAAPVPTVLARSRHFADLMFSGIVFPACSTVLGRNGRYCVINGTHRLCASLLAGFLWLPVIIVAEMPFYPSLRSDGRWM